jgi:hypothetical protein
MEIDRITRRGYDQPGSPNIPEQEQTMNERGYQLDNYTSRRPFASFLPGLAGPQGIPMWVFYVNRGQAIASFGIESKDAPILEFQPANKAYQMTAHTGFRTFIQVLGREGIYEPFAPGSECAPSMRVGMNDVQISEASPAWGLETSVLYFTLPGEPFAALVRQVRLKNTAAHPQSLELLDGLPQILPYGVNNGLLKDMSRTLEAWMEVFNLEQGFPFFRLRASVSDSAEVGRVQAGNFFLSFSSQQGEDCRLPVIVDPPLVFGMDTSFAKPNAFPSGRLGSLLAQPQVTVGKTPCAFTGAAFDLEPGEEVSINTLVGHTPALETIQSAAHRLQSAAYISRKHLEAVDLAWELTSPIACSTALPLFDAYARQTFLDNGLRGGFPARLGQDDVYHLYSRKHGDLERDYNAFFLAAEFYSQGNGNYRDVNQNRRSDVLFYPWVEDFNLLAFTNLLQLDGYNPLLLLGSRFHLPPELIPTLAQMTADPAKVQSVLERPFTPGSLFRSLVDQGIKLNTSPEEFIRAVITHAEQENEARFGEGFWIDHWTYNLDLIESYLSIYPDQKATLLFEKADSTYFDSPVFVLPRSLRYVLSGGEPRQLHAVEHDQEKAQLISARSEKPNIVRTRRGRGEIFYTTLFARLFGLVLVKFSTLDPLGMGVQMEAGKPGWYDALNGMPGLFGSGMSETYELQRLLLFLSDALDEAGAAHTLHVPVETARLLEQIMHQLDAYYHSLLVDRDFKIWDALSEARETYRADTRLGIDGQTVPLSQTELQKALHLIMQKVQEGIQRAMETGSGIPPTYFSYQVTDYESLTGEEGRALADSQGRPYIRALAFRPLPLPPFLEGPVRAMKIQPDARAAERIYQAVHSSELFDPKLHMYRLNGSLDDQPHDIGRARAFPPGWLENGSIWLHMSYKYLLEILKAGLYPQFLEDFKHSLVPFMNPDRYGRSPTENSSFIASSLHPDPSLHGAGFVARLSGATAEFLSLWSLMTAGPQPFFLKDGALCLEFRPCIPGWLFPSQGPLVFTFLGSCQVAVHNPDRTDCLPTSEDQPATGSIERLVLHLRSGSPVEISGPVIPPPYAAQVRADQVEKIDLFWNIDEKEY